MGEHPNAEALQKGYEAFAAGDMEALAALLADDIVWHQSGNSPLSGDFAGKDAIFGDYLPRLAEINAGTYGQAVHDLLANDEHAVVMVESWWEQPHPFKGKGVHVWHMKDGIATEAWFMDLDQAAADASLTP